MHSFLVCFVRVHLLSKLRSSPVRYSTPLYKSSRASVLFPGVSEQQAFVLSFFFFLGYYPLLHFSFLEEAGLLKNKNNYRSWSGFFGRRLAELNLFTKIVLFYGALPPLSPHVSYHLLAYYENMVKCVEMIWCFACMVCSYGLIR